MSKLIKRVLTRHLLGNTDRASLDPDTDQKPGVQLHMQPTTGELLPFSANPKDTEVTLAQPHSLGDLKQVASIAGPQLHAGVSTSRL